MRLWGKVMSGSLLVFAAVFAGVGLIAPEARVASSDRRRVVIDWREVVP